MMAGHRAAGRFTASTATLGRVLAAASRSDSGGELLAEDLHRVIEDKGGAPGYMVALNMMLSAPEAVYDTDFLIGLAGRLESRDPNSMIPPTMHFINGQAGTSDPLTGVLTAMSNNPEAALGFLEPGGGTADDAARVEGLMKRGELGDNSWTDIWARLAERASASHAAEYAPDAGSGSAGAKGAAALSASVVNTIGAATTEVSEAARGDLTRVVAAYPWSVDQAARTDGASHEPVIMPGGTDGQGAETWCHGMSYQPQFTGRGLSGVMQAISRDAGDFQTVADSVAAVEQRRMTFEAGAVGAATQGGGIDAAAPMPTGLNNAIEANSATAAFLQGAGRAAVEGDAEKVDERNKVIVDTLFGLSGFVPGPGDQVSQLWKDTWSFGEDTTKRIAQNATTDALTQHLSEAIDHSQMMREDANRATTVTTITQMIGLGIIPAGQANAAVPGLMDDDGVMDASKLDGAALDQLYDRFVTNGDDTINPGLHDQLTDTDGYYDNGYGRGHGE